MCCGLFLFIVALISRILFITLLPFTAENERAHAGWPGYLPRRLCVGGCGTGHSLPQSKKLTRWQLCIGVCMLCQHLLMHIRVYKVRAMLVFLWFCWCTSSQKYARAEGVGGVNLVLSAANFLHCKGRAGVLCMSLFSLVCVCVLMSSSFLQSSGKRTAVESLCVAAQVSSVYCMPKTLDHACCYLQVLCWTYVYAFFEENSAKRKLFEFVQNNLETYTEQVVKGCVEEEEGEGIWRREEDCTKI